MYRYDEFDQALVDQRVAQFRDQTRRFLAGELTEDEFRPLRLRKRPLHPEARADAARRDSVRPAVVARSCASSRTSPASMTEATATSPRARTSSSTGRALEDVPDILAELADVEMHAIQTCGNCVRNITSDQFAGRRRRRDRRSAAVVRADPAVVDVASGIRVPAAQVQDRRHRRDRRPRGDRWCTTSACRRCATTPGEVGFRVVVGGGLGRTPIIGHVIREFLPGGRAPQLLRRDPARLQPLRPPRQQVQGADQDPGEGADAGRVRAPGRGRVGRACAAARAPCPTRRSRASPRISPIPPYRDFRARQRRLPRGARRQPAVRALGRAQRAARTSAGLRDRHAVAEAHRRAARAT